MFSLGGLSFSLELWSGMPYFSWHELPLPFRNLLTVTNFESDERDRDCEYHFWNSPYGLQSKDKVCRLQRLREKNVFQMFMQESGQIYHRRDVSTDGARAELITRLTNGSAANWESKVLSTHFRVLIWHGVVFAKFTNGSYWKVFVVYCRFLIPKLIS